MYYLRGLPGYVGEPGRGYMVHIDTCSKIGILRNSAQHAKGLVQRHNLNPSNTKL